jgi:hypothetical protein
MKTTLSGLQDLQRHQAALLAGYASQNSLLEPMSETISLTYAVAAHAFLAVFLGKGAACTLPFQDMLAGQNWKGHANTTLSVMLLSLVWLKPSQIFR